MHLIKKSGRTKTDVASLLFISRQSFYNKLNGEAEFKPTEIKALAEILSLSDEQLLSIFFNQNVDKNVYNLKEEN